MLQSAAKCYITQQAWLLFSPYGHLQLTSGLSAFLVKVQYAFFVEEVYVSQAALPQ